MMITQVIGRWIVCWGKMLARLTDLWRSYLPEQYIGVSATTATDGQGAESR